MQIVDTIRLLEISLSYQHVLGHQDDVAGAKGDDKVPLTREALLNVECDQLATAALLTAQPAPNVHFFPAGKFLSMSPAKPSLGNSLMLSVLWSAVAVSSPPSNAAMPGRRPSLIPSTGAISFLFL
jgi:hypothetical protein